MEILHYLEHAATKKPLFRLIFPTRELAIEAASKMNKTPIGKPHSCTVGETTNLWGSLIETCEDEQRCRPQRVLRPTPLSNGIHWIFNQHEHQIKLVKPK